MNKSSLRKEALNKRNALSGQELDALNKKLLKQFKTIDFSEAPNVFLMATSLSFCSINNDESANKPSNATVRTMMFSIVKSVCCF